MEIGMFTSGYQRSKLEDMFKDAKRFGYDYIELWGGRPHGFAYDLQNGELEELLKYQTYYNMPIKGYTPEHNGYPYNFMIGSKVQREDAISYLKTALKVSKQLGAEFMMISTGHAGYEATTTEIWDRLLKSLRELTEYAEQIEQKIILEALTPYETNVCTTANDLQQVFERIDSPYLAGMCDVVPPFVQQESIMGYFKKLGSKMQHIHFVDSDGISDSHIIPGDGLMPLKELAEEIIEWGYNKTVTIELVTNYMNEPALYARRAINRVRELFGG